MKKILISEEKFIPHEFTNLDESDQKLIGEANYQKFVDWFNKIHDVEFKKITYKSDGLKVVGILGYLKNLEPNKLYPVIIYNRGGSGNAGKITVKTIKERIYPFIKAGYIVIASQYRGNDGSEGNDELGGNDVNDVINLYDVIKSLQFADLNNIFMIGFSRGGINTYRTLQQNKLPIKAAAVINGASDLFLFEKLRPDAIPLLKEFIPNYDSKKSEEFSKRSAIDWASDINVPILLIHADNDKVIDISSSIKLADQFLKYKKNYKLITYSGSDHFLNLHLNDSIKEIINWFNLYKIN